MKHPQRQESLHTPLACVGREGVGALAWLRSPSLKSARIHCAVASFAWDGQLLGSYPLAALSDRLRLQYLVNLDFWLAVNFFFFFARFPTTAPPSPCSPATCNSLEDRLGYRTETDFERVTEYEY